MLRKERNILLFAAVYIVISVGFIFHLYDNTRNILDERINSQLLDAALATAIILGDDYHNNIIDKNSKTPEQDMATIMRLTKFNNHIGLAFLYTVIKKNNQAILTSSSASQEELDENSFVQFYEPYSDASDELLNSFERTEPSWVEYSDRWGTFRAVFLPMTSSDGTRYIAAAELAMGEYKSRLTSETIKSTLFAILLFVAISVFILAYSLHIKGTLKQDALTHMRLNDAIKSAAAASHAKSEFLATMSHEIRTPMNAVIGMTELMLNSDLSDEQLHNLQVIQSSGNILLTLINNILDFSKLEEHELKLDVEPFLLQPVVESILTIFQKSGNRNNNKISYSMCTGVPPVVISDPQRLKQILVNLVGNASKFTKNGDIDVTVSVKEKQNDDLTLLFSVRDTGIGISQEKQVNLFEPFTQAEVSTTRVYGGSGLGLSISKRLVEAMKGSISCESEEGQGSVFQFTILCQVAKEADQPVVEEIYSNLEPLSEVCASTPEFSRTYPLRILLAEDNPVNQLVASKMLATLGYEHDIVSNGKEAVQAVVSKGYDVVLMDIQMPEMDGFEASYRIRQFNRLMRPYIIAFTANVLVENNEKFSKADIKDCLTKPVKIEELKSALRKAANFIGVPPIKFRYWIK